MLRVSDAGRLQRCGFPVAGVRKPSMKEPAEMVGGGAANAERYGGLRTTEVREGNRRR